MDEWRKNAPWAPRTGIASTKNWCTHDNEMLHNTNNDVILTCNTHDHDDVILTCNPDDDVILTSNLEDDVPERGT